MIINASDPSTWPPGYSARKNPDGSTRLHLGTSLDGLKPCHLGPHQVAVDGATVDVPTHYWNSDWTYGRTLKVIKSPAQIVAANRMFPLGNVGIALKTVTAKPYAIMGSSSVTPYMPTTGERGDIGLITDWAAWFMLKGDAAPMLEVAQAAQSFPLNMRDEKTGKPVDLIKYPRASCYIDNSQGSNLWVQQYPKDAGGVPIVGGGMVPQQAHFVEMSYVAYLATGDLGFLEDLQYAANFMVMTDAIKSTNAAALISGELRGLAWALRELFMAHIATKDLEDSGTPLPGYLMPSSYFKKLLDNALTYYSPIMKNPNAQLFRVFTGLGKFGIQQSSYMLNALAFGVLTGHSDWTPFYLWCLGQAVALTNGTSGWPVGFGTPVYACQYKDNDPANPRFQSWAECFEDIYTSTEPETRNPYLTAAAYAKLKADPYNGGYAFQDAIRTTQTRGNLILAKYLHSLGLTDVYSQYPELDTCIANADRMVHNGYGIDPRECFVLDASAAPPVIVPLPAPHPVPAPAPVPTTPKPQPQPATEFSMTSSFNIRVGQTVDLAVTNISPPGADISSLRFHAEPADAVKLVPISGGVQALGLKSASVKVFADLDGEDEAGKPTVLERECDGSVTSPLARDFQFGLAA